MASRVKGRVMHRLLPLDTDLVTDLRYASSRRTLDDFRTREPEFPPFAHIGVKRRPP
jgi:hypothetical protein